MNKKLTSIDSGAEKIYDTNLKTVMLYLFRAEVYNILNCRWVLITAHNSGIRKAP